MNEALHNEYTRLWNTMQIRLERCAELSRLCLRIWEHQARYASVADLIGCPWQVVAAIHSLESSLDFNTHLHNGDPLTARTVNVPSSRPAKGNPPFTWEESAEDALSVPPHDWRKFTDWSLPATLYLLECYNGLGHRKYHPEVLTPYLWAGTNHYSKGKYRADGKFSLTLVSKQMGCAAILWELGFAGGAG